MRQFWWTGDHFIGLHQNRGYRVCEPVCEMQQRNGVTDRERQREREGARSAAENSSCLGTLVLRCYCLSGWLAGWLAGYRATPMQFQFLAVSGRAVGDASIRDQPPVKSCASPRDSPSKRNLFLFLLLPHPLHHLAPLLRIIPSFSYLHVISPPNLWISVSLSSAHCPNAPPPPPPRSSSVSAFRMRWPHKRCRKPLSTFPTTRHWSHSILLHLAFSATLHLSIRMNLNFSRKCCIDNHSYYPRIRVHLHPFICMYAIYAIISWIIMEPRRYKMTSATAAWVFRHQVEVHGELETSHLTAVIFGTSHIAAFLIQH